MCLCSGQNGEQPSIVGEKSDDFKKNKTSHIEVQFEDANCNFFCRIYYAEKFAMLRSAVIPVGEDMYIRSLSRSVQWNARGGKSGSTFSKTLGECLILVYLTNSQ